MEIAQLLESALENNRSGLRRAAMNTVTKMVGATPGITVSAVLESDAGDAIRQLTLEDLRAALAFDDERPSNPRSQPRREPREKQNAESDRSREERIYRLILEALEPGPMTIGRLGKTVGLESDELRGYLAWMKRMGKVVSTGRARSTRYSVA